MSGAISLLADGCISSSAAMARHAVECLAYLVSACPYLDRQRAAERVVPLLAMHLGCLTERMSNLTTPMQLEPVARVLSGLLDLVDAAALVQGRFKRIMAEHGVDSELLLHWRNAIATERIGRRLAALVIRLYDNDSDEAASALAQLAPVAWLAAAMDGGCNSSSYAADAAGACAYALTLVPVVVRRTCGGLDSVQGDQLLGALVGGLYAGGWLAEDFAGAAYALVSAHYLNAQQCRELVPALAASLPAPGIMYSDWSLEHLERRPQAAEALDAHRDAIVGAYASMLGGEVAERKEAAHNALQRWCRRSPDANEAVWAAMASEVGRKRVDELEAVWGAREGSTSCGSSTSSSGRISSS